MFSTYCLSASWLLVVASLGIFQFIVEIALVFVLISHSTLSILSYTAFCDGAVVVCPSHPLPYAVSLIAPPVAIVSHAVPLYYAFSMSTPTICTFTRATVSPVIPSIAVLTLS